MIKVILHVSNVLYLIAALLNGLGIYLLTVVRPLSNGKFLLANLAVTEIIVSVTNVAGSLVRAFSASFSNVSRNCLAIAWLGYYSSVFFLTIDRLVAIQFPLRYRVVITKKRVKLAILLAWILVIALGTSFFIENRWSDLF